jgi:hypothetical protein
MYERTYALGFHDLIFGMLRDAGIIPNVCQTAGEMPTLIPLVDSGMGVAILLASTAKRSVASLSESSFFKNLSHSLCRWRGATWLITLPLGYARREGCDQGESRRPFLERIQLPSPARPGAAG